MTAAREMAWDLGSKDHNLESRGAGTEVLGGGRSPRDAQQLDEGHKAKKRCRRLTGVCPSWADVDSGAIS